MNDDRDPILDSCLDEVLGGQAPPDLSARILKKLEQIPPPVEGRTRDDGAPLKVIDKPRPAIPPMPSGSTRPRASAFGLSLTVAAAVILVVGGLGYLAMRLAQPGPSGRPLVESPGADPSAFPPNERTDSRPDSTTPRQDDGTRRFESEEPSLRVMPEPSAVAEVPGPREAPVGRPATMLPEIRELDFEPMSDDEIVKAIDTALNREWQLAGITPGGAVGDAEVCRRLYRHVLGREPTSPELQLYAQDSARDKRERLVDRLLTDEAYVEEFARAWSRFWTNTLVGSPDVALANGASRDGLQQFLRRSFYEDKPFDDVATELLTATGAGQPGAENYHGASNFLIAHYDREGVRAAAHSARVFAGRQLVCAQCHDHPTDSELAQGRFWEWNSFFRQLAVERANPAAVVLSDVDFKGASGGDGTDAEVFYETPGGELRVAYPVLPNVGDLPRDGILSRFDRRSLLARYVANSDDFGRSIANRIWAALLGTGLTTPVDDMGVGNRVSHPAVLDVLAEQFAAHEYDMKSLVRWIALSRPFTLPNAGASGFASDLNGAGGTPLFSRFYPRRTTAVSALESLELIAKAQQRLSTGAAPGTAARIDPLPNRPESNLDRLLPPVSPLTGLPSFEFDPALSGPAVAAILDSSLDREQKIEHLFWVSVHRSPQRRELARVKDMFDMKLGERATLSAVWWALSQSGEGFLDN